MLPRGPLKTEVLYPMVPTTWDDCYDYLHKLGYNVKVEMRRVV